MNVVLSNFPKDSVIFQTHYLEIFRKSNDSNRKIQIENSVGVHAHPEIDNCFMCYLRAIHFIIY